MRFINHDNSRYFHAGPLFHKCLEVGYQAPRPRDWRPGGFNVSLEFKTRGDHAGFAFSLTLWTFFFFEFNVYDRRHWAHKLERFYRPGEQPQFEGYPHE